MRVAGAEVVLILAVSRTVERASTRQRLRRWIDAAVDWVERAALRGGSPALKERRFGPWPEGVRVVTDARPRAQVEAMQTASADVLIDLAPDTASAPVPIPPAGRWHLCYTIGVGGTRRPRLRRPSNWAGLAESMLSIELASGERLETGVGVSALRRSGYSRDRDAVYWRSSLLPARRLTRLVAGEIIPSSGLDTPAPSTVDQAPLTGTPSAIVTVLGLAATVTGKVLERIVFRTGWLVLVRLREPGQDVPRDMSGFEPIGAPAGRFYADPFVVATRDGPRLYVEDCPDGTHRGRISTLRKDADGRWGLEGVVLDDLEHRAYPHVLDTETGLLVTPDSGRSGGVDIFIARGPDLGLERIGRCLDGVSASDPTLLWHDGLYWLFVTVTEHGMSPWDELHLFSSASIGGVWHPHPRNPVIADVRRARPAGRIFRRGDALIRPGQDCSEAYGRRIVLSAITKLTPSDYEERIIGSIEPEGIPGITRTHTYTFDGSIEALDGYRRLRRGPRRARSAR